MQSYFPVHMGRDIHCPELSGGLSIVLQHPIQKQPFFLSPTISTLIARNNYILTKLQSCFCYHHNDSIILNYWRRLTVKLKQCQQKRMSTSKELDGAKYSGVLRRLFKMTQLCLENSSIAFYINLLFLICSCVVSDRLTRVLGNGCEKSFTPGVDEILWWGDVERIRQGGSGSAVFSGHQASQCGSPRKPGSLCQSR